jgi:hypothetical protein
MTIKIIQSKTLIHFALINENRWFLLMLYNNMKDKKFQINNKQDNRS